MDRHNGHCWIEKIKNNGIIFYFAFPLLEAMKEDHAQVVVPGKTIEITYVEDQDLLNARWIGFHDLSSLKDGYLIIVEDAKKT